MPVDQNDVKLMKQVVRYMRRSEYVKRMIPNRDDQIKILIALFPLEVVGAAQGAPNVSDRP